MISKFELGRNIARRRHELGITQAELAERVGTFQHVISMLENGKVYPRIDSLKRISDALHCTVDSLTE